MNRSEPDLDLSQPRRPVPRPVILTSHPSPGSDLERPVWGAPSAAERRPIIATLQDRSQRNAIGTRMPAPIRCIGRSPSPPVNCRRRTGRT